ncbi:MAG: glutathione S-transferase family protein [Roseovarius sp.]
MSDLRLTGYHLSVYTRAARMALVAKGVAYGNEEIDPFDEACAVRLRGLHPFGRVPVLEHGGFRLYETQAILDYVDGAFDGPGLVPDAPQARARMRQVMGIADCYLYWPLVRQVFSHRVFRPLIGADTDEAVVDAGLGKAGPVLDALEEIAGEGLALVPGEMRLETCLLWPMLDYFRMAPQGAEMLAARRALSDWADWAGTLGAARETRPNLPEGEET